ncbi:MAG: hypothetical protein AB9919_07075 [Geobacteraceae bacterium]
MDKKCLKGKKLRQEMDCPGRAVQAEEQRNCRVKRGGQGLQGEKFSIPIIP